mmetsp:Transcript_29497/g.78008  ORF Transcript_29497/g.78008 Transcript_29497/m.78008 type:complete len:265 (+) Transcript_29497:460-1254(+)
MHTHDLPEHVVLSRPKPLFSLPATAFLRLPQLPVTLGKFDHGSNAPLLLEPEQLLGQLIQRLGDHGALHGLENAIEGFLSELFNVPLLLHRGRSLRATFSGSKFIDQVEAFFLPFEHLVLVCPSSDEALQEKNRRLLFLILWLHVLHAWRFGTLKQVAQITLPHAPKSWLCTKAVAFGLKILLDARHRCLECRGHLHLFPNCVARLLLRDLLGMSVQRLQDTWRQGLLELQQARIRRKVSRLYFDACCVGVWNVSMSCLRSVDL